jgi:hypothetical protein
MLIYQIHIGLTAGVPVNRGCLLLLGTRSHAPLVFAEVRASPIFSIDFFHLPDLHTDFDCGYSIHLTGHSDFDCGFFRFPNLHTPNLTVEFCALNGAHGGCNRSTGGAYSLTPDPTSGFSRGLCLLNVLD